MVIDEEDCLDFTRVLNEMSEGVVEKDEEEGIKEEERSQGFVKD